MRRGYRVATVVTTTADELQMQPFVEGDEVLEAPAVLRILWADPKNMAEHLVIWSLARFGPRAELAVGKLRAANPAAGRPELEDRVVQRQARVVATEGAFVGGPFIVLIPVAFCAALLAQAQMVFELAAVSGRDPRDQMRASELLVLLGAYRSTDEACAALAAVKREPREEGKKLPAGTRISMVRNMAYVLGLLGTDDTRRSKLRATIGWTGIGILVLVGLVLPLVWVPYLAYSMRRSTLRLARRARGYYAPDEPGEAAVTVRRAERARIGGIAAFARTLLLVALPVVTALIALLTDLSFGGGRLLTAALILIVLSMLATGLWFGLRWWRRRRRLAAAA
jgi:hypothetical protein